MLSTKLGQKIRTISKNRKIKKITKSNPTDLENIPEQTKPYYDFLNLKL